MHNRIGQSVSKAERPRTTTELTLLTQDPNTRKVHEITGRTQERKYRPVTSLLCQTCHKCAVARGILDGFEVDDKRVAICTLEDRGKKGRFTRALRAVDKGDGRYRSKTKPIRYK